MTPMEADVLREFDRMDRRLLAIEVVPQTQAAMSVELSGLSQDISELKGQFERWTEERKKETVSSALERKSDRRFIVGTIIASAGFIVTALTTLLPALHG